MVVRCTFTISFIALRISTSLLSEIIFIESRLAHIINRAKTQCSFITLTKRYINIFCQLDGGELNYVFSILDKQTNSCRLLSKPKYRTDNVQKMLLVKLFSSQKLNLDPSVFRRIELKQTQCTGCSDGKLEAFGGKSSDVSFTASSAKGENRTEPDISEKGEWGRKRKSTTGFELFEMLFFD